MDINRVIAAELSISEGQAAAAVRLIDEGNTIPFIARYRKEATGALNDEVLRNLFERLQYLRTLEERKASVLKSIEEQGKLTEPLRRQIEEAMTQVAVEDLYRPYKQKRRTRALIAKERGLEPLAMLLLQQKNGMDPELEARRYLDASKELADVKTALAGACDIIAEQVSDDAAVRTWIREKTFRRGSLVSEAKDPQAESPCEMYYQYEEAVGRLPGHRILAVNRGEKEKFLTVHIEAPEEEILSYLDRRLIKNRASAAAAYVTAAYTDAYHRLIAPSIENEIRGQLRDTAEDGAIKVFMKNLEQLLLQPPISGQVVLGWDPGYRTGCKIAVVDPTGKVLDTTVVYPTAPHKKVKETKETIHRLIRKHGVNIISLGNGTASRESEQVITDLIREIPEKVQYIIVNEAGASVYSASKLASEEFPQFDVGQRSAASMARRLQDPLAELVKIDPQSVGVGQYQHDMNQKKLSEGLGGVVEDCVNRVGVDLNTASVSLLSYVSGISKSVAGNIVAYREENGAFTSRTQLKKVPKLGPKAYEQCAGFLRITGGKNPLDATGVHPESYPAAEALLTQLGFTLRDVRDRGTGSIGNAVKDYAKLAASLGIGELTLRDIVKELEKPARDPREDMPGPILRSDVLELKDLKPGMVLKGTVRNVIDFGAFVDIGVHQDGLVHISQMTDRYIKHPLEVVSVGDIVDVKVLSVDEKKGRISLTMKR